MVDKSNRVCCIKCDGNAVCLSARPELWYQTERRKGTDRECKRSTVFLADRLRNAMVSTAACSLPQTEHIFVASLLFLVVL
jgi:hypothetical protein